MQIVSKERRFANMRDFIADTEAKSGELTEAELEVARQYFQLFSMPGPSQPSIETDDPLQP